VINLPEQIFLVLGELDFFVSNITAIIMLLTLLSLLLANLARYVQAKNFGLPLKMVHQAGIPDSLDIWITLICVLGFGLVVPWIMISVRINLVLVFAIIFVSCFIGMASTKSHVGSKKINKDGSVQDIDVSWILYVSIALFTAIFYTYMNAISVNAEIYEASRSVGQSVLLAMARVQRVLHTVFILLPLIFQLYSKVYGNQDLMTVEVEGQLYLIAMRHISNYWILIPCTMGRVKARGSFSIGSNKEEDVMTDAIIFTKGKFIVRDVSNLEAKKDILCRDSYQLVGKKEVSIDN